MGYSAEPCDQQAGMGHQLHRAPGSERLSNINIEGGAEFCMWRCQHESLLGLQVQWERVWGILAMPCDQQAGLGHQAHRAQGSERLINIIIEDGAEFCMRRCQHET